MVLDRITSVLSERPLKSANQKTERGKILNPEYNIFRDQPTPGASPLRINTLLSREVGHLPDSTLWIRFNSILIIPSGLGGVRVNSAESSATHIAVLEMSLALSAVRSTFAANLSIRSENVPSDSRRGILFALLFRASAFSLLSLLLKLRKPKNTAPIIPIAIVAPAFESPFFSRPATSPAVRPAVGIANNSKYRMVMFQFKRDNVRVIRAANPIC